MLLDDVREHYLNSEYFLQLSNLSQKEYQRTLGAVSLETVKGRRFGRYTVDKINTALCRELYFKIVHNTTVQTANARSRILSVLLNYAVSLDLLPHNPMSLVKKLKHEPNTLIWTQEQVERILDEAYSRYRYRNIGLLTQMCYEWGQRPVDISKLTWDAFDWSSSSVTITQSKRGATVHLPLEEPLLSLLADQEEDWGFQPYVVPHTVPSGSVYKPMTAQQISQLFRELREAAGLGSELRLGALRKTAIMEMVEAGVDATGIMQVSGHQNITSLNPYMKHTLKGAKSALSQRRKNND